MTLLKIDAVTRRLVDEIDGGESTDLTREEKLSSIYRQVLSILVFFCYDQEGWTDDRAASPDI
jgi:hypothetical protein